MLRTLGADLVGMSTALEAIAAHAAGRGGVRAVAGHQRRRRGHRREAGRTTRCIAAGKAAAGRLGRVPGRVHRAAAVSGSCWSPARRAGSAPGCAAGCPSAAGRCAASTSSRCPTSGRARSSSSPTSPTWPRWSTPPGRRRRGPPGRHRRASRRGRRSAHANIEGTYARSRRPAGPACSGWCWPAATTPAGYTPRPDGGLLREADAPPRPDTYYGVAKVAMEALGSLYADRYGMDVVCLRIGSAFAEPTTVRQLATWLSPADTVVAGRRRAAAPVPGFAVVWGVSANTRNWWDLTAARALGLRAGRRRRGLRRGADRGARRARPGRPGARPRRRRVHAAASSTPRTSRPSRGPAVTRPAGAGPRLGRRRPARGRPRRDRGADRGRRTSTELARRFAGPLTFGTAGLRGPLRAGPAGHERRRGHPGRRRARRATSPTHGHAGRRRGHRLRRPAPVRRVRAHHRRGARRAPASPSRCCPGRCRRRCCPSPSAIWAARPA